MDELDELDSPEEDQPAEAAGAGTSLADLKKLRSENKGLRTRLKEAQDQVLTTRFRPEVLDLIPEEVTDFERRVALAEKYAQVMPGSEAPSQTGEAAAEVAPEVTEAEQKLAAVTSGPTTAESTGKLYSSEEIRQIGLTDPTRANQILEAQFDSATGQLRTT